MMLRIPLILSLLFLVSPSTPAQEVVKKFPETPQAVEAGKKLYMKRCWFCHGREGKGNGPVAEYLYPRPRDFTLGQYKFRTTPSGEPPTDEDLFRTITRGIPGTAMPAWNTLKEEERWQLVYFIKTFSENPWPRPGPQPVKFGKEPSRSDELIKKGQEVFKKAKCWECHGDTGRGEGPSAPTLKDDLGFPIKAFDLTKSWLYKGGNSSRDIFTRFSTGVDGTPMPSFADTLSDEERWALAYYVESIQSPDVPGADVIIKAHRVEGELPTDPDAPAWQKAKPLVIPLSGQVLVKPRWQIPSVDTVVIRALFNEKSIAFLIVWDDPFKDTVHQPSPAEGKPEYQSTYVKIDPEKLRAEPLRDAIALQFPVRIPEGPERPHFFRGDPGRPVVLWEWRADWNEDKNRKTAVEVYNAQGFKKPYLPLPPESQEVMGKGVWEKGQWKVVMIRPLEPRDKGKEITFARGRLIPLAVQVWDGSNGERDLLMALSSWNFLLIPRPTPIGVYLSSFIGLAAVGGLEWLLVRNVRKKSFSP